MKGAVAALAAAAALAVPAAADAYAPNDPFVSRQWYLAADAAFDAWPAPPVIPPVKVAVVDSGVDNTYPELTRRIVAARSFVDKAPFLDRQGHGTFVAGMIAAETNNGYGIAGIGVSAQLLVAKIVTADGRIPIEAEAAAIRWSVDHGARVINLSIGGVRDPLDPTRDTYSALEASAVRYAYGKGAVLVAAVGNADQSPTVPWPYASYPAALPHVIGVSAYGRGGAVPAFSNRDAIYNDLSAPGEDIFSTFPRQLTAQRPTCVDQGFSDCGPDDYRHAEGTSFAAPQVSAAAALLLGLDAALRPDQVAALVEHSAVDANATNGCKKCPLLRDSLSGWGRLDVAAAVAALAGPLPVADRLEPNDDAGTQARTLSNRTTRVRATLDYYDDPQDVYRVHLQAGRRVTVRATGPAGAETNLVLWKPGTRRVDETRASSLRSAQSVGPASAERIAYTPPKTGWYYVELKVGSAGFGPYTLTLARAK